MKTVIAIFLLLCAGCGRQPAEKVDSGNIRIVSLAPNLTEAVYAVGAGDLLVGRDSASDYPPAVTNVPVAGGFGRPSLEALIELKPTVVLVSDLADSSVGAKMDALGIRRVTLATGSLNEVADMLRQVGRLSGHSDAGERLAASMEQSIEQMRRQNRNKKRPKVYAEIWGDPMTTCGRGSVLDEMIELAGGDNIGHATARDYFKISAETVVTAAPDVILCLYMRQGAGVAKSVMKRPGWSSVPAITSGAVYDELDNDLILRPGPRIMQGVAILQNCFNRRDKNRAVEDPSVKAESKP